jgi:hypothetical protein
MQSALINDLLATLDKLSVGARRFPSGSRQG